MGKQLSKRTVTVRGHGGAGPFHAPQRPGRSNYASAVHSDGQKGRPIPPTPARGLDSHRVTSAAKREQRRGVFRRAVDRVLQRAA